MTDMKNEGRAECCSYVIFMLNIACMVYSILVCSILHRCQKLAINEIHIDENFLHCILRESSYEKGSPHLITL